MTAAAFATVASTFVAGPGSITFALTGALNVPASGTRHSKASSLPAHRRLRQPVFRHMAVRGPGRIGRGMQRARHPFAGAAFVVLFGAFDSAINSADALVGASR